MHKTCDVAVVGCDTLVGEAILALLEERDFPLGTVHAIASEGGGRTEFKDRQLKVVSLKTFDFSQADLAFFCIDPELAEQYAAKAAAAGCIVIDDSPCFRFENDVPLVVADVNPAALTGYFKRNIVANPGTNATLLTAVLKPLHDAIGVARVNVVTLQAVSGKDKAGVEELARQSMAMFNLQNIEGEVFEKQIAFNLLPQIGAILEDGYTGEERKLAAESAKILGNAIPVNATCVRVPVFHAHAMVLHVEMTQDVEIGEVKNLLEAIDSIRVTTDEFATPATDAVGQDTIFVSRLRQDNTYKKAINMWLVADNIRKGAALNSVQLAEILLKEHLN